MRNDDYFYRRTLRLLCNHHFSFLISHSSLSKTYFHLMAAGRIGDESAGEG